MFCLRSWIPILFFLKNASPIYLILFISATYFLNRPCVYCSLLLAILVVSLFDFHASWFESASSVQATAATVLPDYIVSAVSAATDNAVVGVVDQAVEKLMTRVGASGMESTFVEWMKGVLRREWRVQCLDLVIRL